MTLQATSDFASLRVEDSSWDYRGEPTKMYTHGFHSYPAMMIPQVAKRLIETYSKSGNTLLDPFCGSGSVLVEGLLAMHNCWGIDLNPLAILIAKVKTTPLNPIALRSALRQVMDEIRHLSPAELTPPRFFNLEFWFKEDVIEDLTRIKWSIERIADQEVRDFFKVAFSEAVRLCSNSRRGEFKLFRYSTEALDRHRPDTINVFLKKAVANIEQMHDFYEHLPRDHWVRLIEADSTKLALQIPLGTVDIVVTSPPYGDSRTTVAYGQFSRLSAQWLGLLPERAPDIDKEMLGGKPGTGVLGDEALPSPTLQHSLEIINDRDPSRAKLVLSFYRDLWKSLMNIAQYLKVGGHACIVIGNRRVKGLQLATDGIICELGVELGLEPLSITLRNIPNKAMPLRNSPTNVPGVVAETMQKESIVVLRKQA